MFGYDSKLKLKELLLFYAEQELAIEKMRQILAAIRDFEPYAAFKRIDRNNSGYIGTKEICQFERENGYREVSPEDFIFMVTYFDLDGDGKLNYHDFLQILLPCDNPYLRSAATQRPNQELYPNEFLPMRVERAMSQLIYKEVKLHLKAENIKRSLESSYDFSVRAAFRAVDDWNYNYIDKQNLKRFLRSMGHLASKQEIVAILRRFDLDGDAKINLQEFGEAIKTQLAASRPVKLRQQEMEIEKAKNRGSSHGARSSKRGYSASFKQESPRKSQGSFGGAGFSSGILKSGRKKGRPKTADRATAGYNPNRGASGYQAGGGYGGSPMQGASPGVSYSPYSVPNAARIPAPNQHGVNQKGRGVSFERNQGHGGYGRAAGGLPTEMTSGMGYLNEQIGRHGPEGSPLRNASPRRSQEIKANARGAPADMSRPGVDSGNSYGRLPGRTSPLRSRSPRRDSPLYQADVQVHQSFTQEQPPRNVAAMAGGIGSYDRVEQAEFSKVLKDNIFLERELESARIEAALKNDFNLLDAFKIFDTRGTGNISVQDVITSLRETLGFAQFTHDDVYLLFRRHDGNQDGKLNFTEFSNVLLPVSKEYAALLTDRPDFYMSRQLPISQFFTADTRTEFRNLWAALFKCERACEVLRSSLRQRPYFNLKQAFGFMDVNNNGALSINEIRDFLANNGFFATERELQGLTQKCDKTGDGKVSFNEFVDEFSPKLGF